MIDTIVFKLHDMSDEGHKAIMDYLIDEGNMDKNQWHKIGRAVFVNKDEYIQKESKLRMQEFLDVAFDGVERRRAHIYGGFPVPSYHYDVIWKEGIDCIEFQMSIPKYLFGHNVAQFVPSPLNKHFNKHGFAKMQSMKFQASLAYERLLEFIPQFFRENFIDVPVDLKKVELRRLDVCFNQYFLNKNEALKYLNLQKRVVKAYAREGSSYGQDEWTSTNYKTAYYGLKIYHKGSEFRKHDKKRMMNYNKEIARGLGLGYKKKKDSVSSFDVEFLQDEADRILRYELSISTPGLSYFFKRYVFRRQDMDYKNMLKDFNEIKNIYENPLPESEAEYYARDIEWKKLERRLSRATTLEKKAELIFKMKKFKAERTGGRRILTKEDKVFYKAFNKWIGKRHEFYPYRPCNTEKETNAIGGYRFPHVKEQGFPKNLFLHVFGRLENDFKQFQIKQMPTMDEMLEALRRYNIDVQIKKERWKDLIDKGLMNKAEREKKGLTEMRESKMIPLFMLLRTKTIDEIRRERIFADRTMTRYVSELKKLQVFRSTIVSDPIVAGKDFNDYYLVLLDSRHNKFFSQPVMMHF